MSERELKPCPFCGNENVAIANECHDLSGGYFIACPACGGSTGLRYACGDDPRPLLIEQWNRRTARSGQAASGSSQGARSDEAVKRFGIKPWSTLAQLKDDEDLELYVQARIEAEGVGQPEAPAITVLAWKLRRAAEILDRDGDEHGIAADLWSMLADNGTPAKTPTAAPLGWKLVPTDPSNAMLLPIVRAFKCGHAEAWKVLSEAIAAHPPARSGAGSEEAQPDRSEES